MSQLTNKQTHILKLTYHYLISLWDLTTTWEKLRGQKLKIF